MSVGHPFSLRVEVVAPVVQLAGQAAARRELPLGLSGKTLVRPLGVGLGVGIRDLDDRIVASADDRAARAGGMPPAGALHIAPPLKVIVERNRTRRGCEDDAARDQILGGSAGE